MTWFNEYEVAELVAMYPGDPILRPAVMTLASLVAWTNANSDGWPYWKKPARAADKLMTLIAAAHSPSLGDHVEPTVEAYRKALVPIKAFRTRQGAEFPIYELSPQVVRLEELRVELRAERISYGEIAELQSLAGHIEPGDVELLEWAGVSEFPADGEDRYGRVWPFPASERCPQCGQPDNCGDCNHNPLSESEVTALLDGISFRPGTLLGEGGTA